MAAVTDPSTPSPGPPPPAINYVVSFLLVGMCWGFTTPFIRKAAVNYQAPSHPSITDPSRPWLARQAAKVFYSIVGLLRSPAYAIPLVLNLTGSVWFFLLVGKAGEGDRFPSLRLIQILPFLPVLTSFSFCS